MQGEKSGWYSMSGSGSSRQVSLPDNAVGWLILARRLAVEAGTLVMSLGQGGKSGSGLRIESKTTGVDLVTSADLASQDVIVRGIAEAFPSHRVIAEEDGEKYGELDERATWIVDAVDGTTNFVHGLRDWAVSIAFVKGRVVEVGVVYCAMGGELFYGVRGCGAYMNDRRIGVSDVRGLGEAVVVSEWGYERGGEGVKRMLEVNERLLKRGVRGVRQLGSGSLDMCYVAMGRVEGVYCGVAGEAWKIWDYAAGCVIVREAGGELRTVDGAEFEITAASMVCATPGVMHELLEVIHG